MKLHILRRLAGALGPLACAALAVAVGVAKPNNVRADGEATAVEKRERCATRLSVALLGKTATPEMLASANPQDLVDGMLGNADFIERFSRFANATFNEEPGETLPDDASYTLAKFVLAGNKPWKEMFVGAYDVANTVTPKADGLGYFRSTAWMRRYAGNELAGYRIVAAYRILQNTTGLALTATTNVEGVDLSAKGREAAACAGCHYANWYALDKVSKILSLRKGMGDNMTFAAPTEGPQQILNGTIANDKELVESLVASPNFKFNACRLAFKFLYGRAENTCEGQIFDNCVDAFDKAGTMQAALKTVATDPSYCQ